MKRYLIAVLAAVAPLAEAGPPLPIVPMVGTDGEPFGTYDEVCGFPILETRLPQLALAMRDTRGDPVIVLDPILRSPGHEARRVFLIAHECGHHKLSHTESGTVRIRATDPELVRDQELSADCWAAEELIRAGEQDVIRQIAEDFFSQGHLSPGNGYPSGIQRSRLIIQCAGLS